MIYENMTLEEIVKYINEELDKGRTMKSIELDDFGVNERTIVKRLERRKVTKVNGRYVLKGTPDSPLADRVGSIAPIKSNTKSKEIIIREPINIIEDNNFMLLLNRVDFLENAVKKLILESSSNSSTDDVGLIVYSSDDKPVAKTVRLYKEIWEALDKVKEVFPHLSAQTIINSLLKEVTDKYLK